MGGKTQVARHLVQAILDDGAPRDRWFEPFVGGGNVLERAVPFFDRSAGMDTHRDLILMWQALSAGWLPPEFVSRGEYTALRNAPSSALRGFAGFGASFGGKWFGGYAVSKIDAKHKYAEECRAAYHVAARQGALFQKYGTRFVHGAFGSYEPPPGTTVYCDPPYRGTTGYTTGEFDHATFYRTLKEWAARGNAVYVSEYSDPVDVPFRTVWQRTKRNTLKAGDNGVVVTERLFRIGETQ